MNKRILILAMTVFTLVVMTLPMIPTAQAWGWRRPTEIYRDVEIFGTCYWTYSDADVWEWRNTKYGRYTANGYAFICWDCASSPCNPMVDTKLIGSGTYDVDYTINLNTMKGVIHIKSLITLGATTPEDPSDDGTFEGHEFLIGELTLDSNDIANLDSGNFYSLLRGTGAYAGWTIVRKMQFENGAWAASNNYLIKPID
jgi:hypothetical protein